MLWPRLHLEDGAPGLGPTRRKPISWEIGGGAGSSRDDRLDVLDP